jgi:hypothetical protein
MYPSTLGSSTLAPISQLYVHTNVSDYSSLSCTGAQDIIAVIQVTENYGAVRPLYIVESPLDTEAIRLEDGLLSTLRFSFKDRYGTPVPFPPTTSVYISLTILELPTI